MICDSDGNTIAEPGPDASSTDEDVLVYDVAPGNVNTAPPLAYTLAPSRFVSDGKLWAKPLDKDVDVMLCSDG